MSFIIVVLCLALLIVLISYFKVDAFIAFLISSILPSIAPNTIINVNPPKILPIPLFTESGSFSNGMPKAMPAKIEEMRMVYLKGSGFADLRGHFVIVCLFAVFFNLLAVISYRKKG